MPSYLLVVFIWPLVYPEHLKDLFYLLPIDLLGIQTSFHTLFGILHNGGTWFVSCSLLCYICYPLIKSVTQSANKNVAVIAILVTQFILIYSNTIIIPIYSLESLYSNPIARVAEFLIGVAFSETVFYRNRGSCGGDEKGCVSLRIIIFMSIVAVVIGRFNHANLHTIVFRYLVISVILFVLNISAFVDMYFLEKNKVLKTFSAMSYQFF